MNDVEQAQLAEKAEDLILALRSVGLYESLGEAVRFADAGRPVVILDLTIGDLAFAPRTQAPEQDAMDREFATLTAGFDSDVSDILDRISDGGSFWEEA